ncbi:protein kinase [Candidatus Uabimicrobium sp. HlEnr_7]|uniref:protein kinase domain-containing protein n=1 Tax=Candidatus Uabimicrobium helgolandensis TaxID=3095367 RepID=UPI003556D66D
MIKVTCPACKKKYSIIDRMGGSEIRCQSCDYIFVAPKKKEDVWISTICTKCSKLYKVSDDMLGKKFSCRRCDHNFKVTNFDSQEQIKARCPGCEKRYRIVNKKLFGKTIQCKVCHTQFDVVAMTEPKEDYDVVDSSPTVGRFDPAGQTFPILPNKIAQNLTTKNTQNTQIPVRKVNLKARSKQRKKQPRSQPPVRDSGKPVRTSRTAPKKMSDKALEFATAETLNPQNEVMQKEIARQIQEMENPVQTAKMPLKKASSKELERATAETLNPQNKEVQDEISRQIDNMESPVYTAKMPPKEMSDKALEFATAETLDPQNEIMQEEIARQINNMEQPVRTTKMPSKKISDEEMNFASGETLNPQNENTQQEIARQISNMEEHEHEDEDEHEHEHENENEEYEDEEYEDEDIDLLGVNLRDTAEEIIIDDFLDEEEQEEEEEDYDDYDYDNLDLRNTAEGIIIDDSIIGLEDQAEEEIIEEPSRESESSHNMAAIEADSDAALNSEDSFLQINSQDELIPSEIMMPEDSILTPSEISIPVPTHQRFPFDSGFGMDEELEKTASMAIIDAETETEDHWVEEKENDWNIGDVIMGIYSVTEEIGTGEKGKVYKIYHKQLGINIAVKNIDIVFDMKETFEEILDSWGQLNGHLNILNYYYTRSIKGISRIFMEYVNGNDLSFLLREGHSGLDSLYKEDSYSSLKRVLDVSIQSSWAFSYAHEKNVIHGDVKPNNIIIANDGTVKISDFGVRSVCNLDNYTQVYSSTKEGEYGDIWSWGLCILHMFAGVSYWNDGNNAKKVLEMYGDQDIPHHVPVMPDEVKQLLEKCFSEEPPSFEKITEELRKTYYSCLEIDYPRQLVDASANLADALNNRAVFFTDIERFDIANELLEKALVVDNYHLNAVYNYGLLQWRQGNITDQELIQKLNVVLPVEKKKWKTYHLLGWVHIERGDKEQAYSCLRTSEDLAENNMVAKNLISQTMDRMKDSYVLQRTLIGHEDSVGSVCVSDDSNIAISSGSDNTIRIWDVRLGECQSVLSGHTGYVNGVSLTPDGLTLVSASWDKSVRIWNVEKRECINVIRGHEHYVNDVAISHDGKIAISASWDQTLRVWETATGLCKKILKGHSDNVNSVGFSSEVDIVISGSSDGTVRVWDINSGECLRVLKGHDGQVWDVAITSDGDMAVSVGWDHSVKIWDIWTGECLRTMRGHTDKVSGVYLTKNAQRILTSSWDGTLKVWDVYNGRCLRTIEGHDDKVYSVTMSDLAQIMISASADQSLQVWKLANEVQEAPFTVVRSKENADNRANQNLVAILLVEAKKALDNEKWEAATNLLNTARQKRGYERYPECLDLWKKLSYYTIRGGLKGAWQENNLKQHRYCIESLAISSDGSKCFSTNYNKIHMWDLKNNECSMELEGHSTKVKKIVFVESKNILISCGDDKTLRIWDLSTGECRHRLEHHKYSVRDFAVMTNGYLGITASYKNLSVWNIKEGKFLFDLIGHEHWVECVAITNDGRMAVSGGYDKTIRVWDIHSAKCIKILRGHEDSVRSVVVTTDGRMAISGSYDNTIKLWDISTGNCLNTFKGHKDRVEDIAMSQDGQILVSVSWDKTLRMWDILTGKCLCVLEGHMSKLRCVALSTNAQFALAGGWGKSVIVWNLDWELTAKSKSKWDDSVRMWLQSFLSLHTPLESEDPNNPLFLVRKGKPVWQQEDFDDLLRQLKNAGLGWVSEDKIKSNLEAMSDNWNEPPVLPGIK